MRWQKWVSQKSKAGLIAVRPIPFREFLSIFWRNLDKNDPDGDEWIWLIADDGFYNQLSAFLNKLRVAKQKIMREKIQLLLIWVLILYNAYIFSVWQ